MKTVHSIVLAILICLCACTKADNTDPATDNSDPAPYADKIVGERQYRYNSSSIGGSTITHYYSADTALTITRNNDTLNAINAAFKYNNLSRDNAYVEYVAVSDPFKVEFCTIVLRYYHERDSISIKGDLSGPGHWSSSFTYQSYKK